METSFNVDDSIDLSISEIKSNLDDALNSSFKFSDNTDPLLDISLLLNDSIIIEDIENISSKNINRVIPLLKKYRNINKLYDWQYECLSIDKLFTERLNLLYSCPTSGGKTLVADILAISTLLDLRKSVIFAVPFISIAHEKVSAMAPFGVDLAFYVEEYAGSKGTFPPRFNRKRPTFYVATYEKADHLLNEYIMHEQVDKLGMIVIDEVHMLTEENSSRGGMLELFLTKILFGKLDIQIVAMSATLKNGREICHFLSSEFYSSGSRPVTISEYVSCQSEIYAINPSVPKSDVFLTYHRSLEKNMNKNDTNSPDISDIVQLVAEVVPNDSVLVFCPTKKSCETTSLSLTAGLPRKLYSYKSKEKHSLIQSLNISVGGVCKVLEKTIKVGVGYHHSGLTDDERKLIEEAYLNSVIQVLCCTSTLAAGVNLPARRVILRSPFIASSIMRHDKYRQMIGRAGRPGINDVAESFMVVTPNHVETLRQVIFDVENEVDSDLKSLKKLTGRLGNDVLASGALSLFVLKICTSTNDLLKFFKRTLTWSLLSNSVSISDNFEEKQKSLPEIVNDTILLLTDAGFIEVNQLSQGEDEVVISDVGKAVFQSGLPLKYYEPLIEFLSEANESLVLSSDFHLIYLCVPMDDALSFCITDPLKLSQIMHSPFFKNDRKVFQSLGYTEQFFCRMISQSSSQKLDQIVPVSKLRKISNSILIYSMYKGKSIFSISTEFCVTRGYLQHLFSSCLSFCSMMVRFTKNSAKLWALNLVLAAFQQKLSQSDLTDLLPLLDIAGVKMARARQFFRAGYKNIASLANEDPLVLMQNIPNLSRNVAYNVVSSSKLLLMEKMEQLQDMVDDLMNPSNDMK